MLKDLLVEASYIANGGINHCPTYRVFFLLFLPILSTKMKNGGQPINPVEDHSDCEKISFCIHILTANPLLALQILTPNHFLFYEPALSRCQINGTEMLRVNLSACFELKTRTASTTAIKRNTSWDGLLRFEAISPDQRVAKTNSLYKECSCLLSKFVNWLSKFVDLS